MRGLTVPMDYVPILVVYALSLFYLLVPVGMCLVNQLKEELT